MNSGLEMPREDAVTRMEVEAGRVVAVWSLTGRSVRLWRPQGSRGPAFTWLRAARERAGARRA